LLGFRAAVFASAIIISSGGILIGTNGYGDHQMKRILLSLAASAIAFSGAVPAQAVAVDRIAIIDSYFDVRAVSGPTTSICVADRGCAAQPSNTSAAVYSHGTKMAQIVRRFNPTAHLVLIRAGSVVTSTLYDANGREISAGFEAVPADVKVVSIAIYSNGNGTVDGTGCRPSTATKTGTVAVVTELNRAIKAVDSIAARGGVVIGAAGNANRPLGLNYPACLHNVQSVTLPLLTGTLNPNLDILLLPNGNSLGGIVNTTSGATAYVTGNWDIYGDYIIPNVRNAVSLVRF
jgi:hypothetical protein